MLNKREDEENKARAFQGYSRKRAVNEREALNDDERASRHPRKPR
jgi:hypothetical protein